MAENDMEQTSQAILPDAHGSSDTEPPILRMKDNPNGGLPVFIRKYRLYDGGPVHKHEYMQINYIYRGKAKHMINGTEFNVMKGDIFVIPPFVPHLITSEPGERAEIYEFEFMPEFINQNFKDFKNAESFLDFAYIEPFLVSENLVKPRLNLVGKVQVEVEADLNSCLKEFTEKKPGYVLLIKSLLLKILVVVGREFTTYLENSKSRSIYDRHRDAIMGAIQYIEENFRNDLSVDEVARQYMLSPSYFSYLFKSITSKTFTEYLNGLRISCALELLKTTDKRVLEICYDVGFNNVNHFNRMFKQYVGMSPVVYRKSQ
jgi:AraC-like DNA-binding protein/mannose-6-phosphate isomerase-like protein (cupin superfamily)